jgi:hypothetical protein
MRARWKYIVYLDEDGEEVLETFEPAIIHAKYAENAGVPRGRIVSAGFATAERECYGASTSLGVNSRPRADTALLRDG